MAKKVEAGSGRWVLVTGASFGIGECFARRFAQEGWKVVLVGRSAEKLRALAEDLKRLTNAESFILPMDLTERNAAGKIYEWVKQNGITLDGLINNAGVGYTGTFAQKEIEPYLKMIDLNVRALVELTHFFLRPMIERKRGFVMNVSSTACFQPMPYTAVYAATKSFVTSFTEALWLEARGTGVRVLNVCPGLTKTEFGIRSGSRDFRLDRWAEDPERVVASAVRALKGNMPTVISNWRNRMLVILERFIPHRLLLWLSLLVQKSRGRM